MIKEKDKVRYQGTKPVMIPHDINPSGGTEVKVSLEIRKVRKKQRKLVEAPAPSAAKTAIVEADIPSEPVKNIQKESAIVRQDIDHLNQIDIRYHKSPELWNLNGSSSISRFRNEDCTNNGGISGGVWTQDVSVCKLEIDIHYVAQAGNVGFVKGDVTWLDGKGQAQRMSFIRNFSKTIEETADVMMKLVKQHVNRQYRFVKHQKYWVLANYGLEYWKLKDRSQLLGEGKRLFRLSRKKVGACDRSEVSALSLQ